MLFMVNMLYKGIYIMLVDTNYSVLCLKQITQCKYCISSQSMLCYTSVEYFV